MLTLLKTFVTHRACGDGRTQRATWSWLVLVWSLHGQALPNIAEGADPIAPPPLVLPTRDPIALCKLAKLGPGPVKENSGIVKSRSTPNLFWMHNDSDDDPRVYPINALGVNYQSSRYAETPGVLIGDAINVDWEDITMDAEGNLIVADVGNNGNDRRDLVLYYLFEPAAVAGRTTLRKKVFVHYPDQRQFPAPADDFNFDCEAVFTVGNTVHLLSKQRSGTVAKLYRLDDPQPERSNPLTLVERFDFQGQAVGADATADGLRLIVVTYEALWLFERDSTDQGFFSGRISWAPYKSQQVEAVCFADEQLVYLADEDLGELFAADLRHLTRLSPPDAESVEGR